MLVGQQVGPFLIEKELGAGAMGAVYRGKYVKTGQVVAVKVMAPGLGTTNDNAAARFERESKILKQLNHPNIVRLFGVGKHHKTPYYAMEYVKGESLDRVMARRERMSWEEVVDLGQQLCAALHHAHQAGIVHRDLKPSNLMILEDGTLKLTDFGIAKDLDVTGITGANCTVGTAAYMSPEQCKGDPNLTHKSDLYSLGVVLYELATGRKPFTAETAMDMFMLHVSGTFVRPAKVVLDMPVWLDTLICQLLEKNPEHRPLDAAMVGQALAGIKEKVEAQQLAGIDAVKAKRMDRPRDQRAASDEDREAARALSGKKGRKKKEKDKGKRAMLILQAGGILLALGAVVALLIFLMRPPSAESLHAQARRLWEKNTDDAKAKAYDGPIKEYLRLYGSLDDDRTREVRRWAEDHEVRNYENLLDRHVRSMTGKGILKVQAKSDAQESAFKAALAEHEGDREEATKRWQEAAKTEDDAGLRAVARRHLEMLAGIDELEKQFAVVRAEIRANRAEPNPPMEENRQKAFLAWRQEQLGDLAGARLAYDRLRESAAKDVNLRFWAVLGAAKARQLKEALEKKPQGEEARVAAVRKALDEAKKLSSLLDRRVVAQDVVTLYEKEPEMAEPVKLAKELMNQIDGKVSK